MGCLVFALIESTLSLSLRIRPRMQPPAQPVRLATGCLVVAPHDEVR